ncbi:DUF1878 family protein [Jeotgalibacillus sp. R-1-5s-1]|uniref:DUF1878 family protein n=1 Tax=Jeotgalibacillus sp. R-1-5s-1 TaxID=2555897 RepID=UPI00106D9F3A|nr:DUF1878 family protein [Jeotgalibacillus sp. R-1-5s-1]
MELNEILKIFSLMIVICLQQLQTLLLKLYYSLHFNRKYLPPFYIILKEMSPLNPQKEIEILKYKVELLSKMVNQNEYPFFAFLFDYDVTETEHMAIMDILYVFNHRLKDTTDENSKAFFTKRKKLFSQKNMNYQ